MACRASSRRPAQPRQHEGYLLDGVIRFDETHQEDPHPPGPRLGLTSEAQEAAGPLCI